MEFDPDATLLVDLRESGMSEIYVMSDGMPDTLWLFSHREGGLVVVAAGGREDGSGSVGAFAALR